MDRDPPNPYRDMTLRELFQHLGQRGADLLNERPVGRRDTAYMLFVAASRLSPEDLFIGKPAHQVRQGVNVLDAYWPDFESEVRAVMHNTFEHARDAAQLTWEDLHRYAATMRERDTWHGWDIGTEEAFRRSLQQLQDLKELKARGWTD